ncbi:transient receptor potential channel pyrexia [Aethina tumida]|uniref:transient receptor potential channel pyrexia n=1 Tax=Aethina tumida TaxID=116153 RepID=UPI002148406D|nr:transient receptor potential channel pyrexia [Aethina tumida]
MTLILLQNKKYNSLHEAVVHGSYSSVCSFIDAKTDVNQRDDNGNTPLLLAVCVQQEETYNKIVAILIENGADVNATNKGLTPLYNAVFYKRLESIKLLLAAGAWLNTDPSKYELHILAQQGEKEILNLFLKDPKCTPDMINFADLKGRTAVYFAAENCHKSTLKMLIKHGGVLNTECEDGTVIETIFEEVSSPVVFLKELLDSNISMQKIMMYGKETKNKKNYIIDFSILAPRPSARQMTVISNLLASASDEEKTEVLQHPLIDLFLSLKWAKIRFIFYWLIVIHFVFATSISSYVFLFVHDVKNDFPKLRIIAIFSQFLTSMLLLGYGVLQCVLVKGNHFRRFEMWMSIINSVLSLVVAGLAITKLDNVNIKDCPNWVLHVTSVAVLLAWIQLMLLIGRLPTFGYYALMFAAVLQNVIKVLLTFLCLIIGFALAFSIQFHDFVQFGNPWHAIIKTTVMMTGEFEYTDLFHSTDNNHRLTGPTQVMFLSFIILTSVVLMNLMVGLAVSDIQGLQQESLARKLEKQAEFLDQLEELVYIKSANSKFVPQCVNNVFLKRLVIPLNFTIEATASFQKRNNLSKRLIDSIVCIAKKRKTEA